MNGGKFYMICGPVIDVAPSMPVLKFISRFKKGFPKSKYPDGYLKIADKMDEQSIRNIL